MSTVPLILDAEQLAGAWLRENAAVAATGAKVAGGAPAATTRGPWLRVTQLDATPIPRARGDRINDYMLQFDCYAGSDAMAAHSGQIEAQTLARQVRKALKELSGTVADDVAIARVRVTGPLHAPDTDYEPARERYVLTAYLLMHAL